VSGTLDDAVEALGKQLERWNVPGLEVAVVREGEVLIADGLGAADVEGGMSAGPATLFHHGSCTKAFTALVATVLADDGVLDLDAPVRRYVPELRLPDPVIADRVTTRDLLSHRAGFARHDFAWILNPSWTRSELVRRLAELPLAGDLRGQWLYSNFGYALAGLVIDRASGSTWEAELERRVLAPLGMARTTTDVGRCLADPDHASAHFERDGRVVRGDYRVCGGMGPAGQLMSCAEDSARWLLLHTVGAAAVPVAAVEATHHMHMPFPAGASSVGELQLEAYGLGWVTGRYGGRRLIWHNGGIDGFRTDLLLLPDDAIGVLASANLHGTSLSLAAVLSIADALVGGGQVDDWYEKLRPAPSEPSGAGSSAAGPPAGPMHELASYAGTYTDPGYGDLVVTASGDELAVQLGESFLPATHRRFETWDLLYPALDERTTVTFFTDADGIVSEAVLPLDPTAPPIRLKRS
jgi:CubicO group peptidase (beta-lactamase class C family)